jgi:deoxyribodipyrimidine photo-lyase
VTGKASASGSESAQGEGWIASRLKAADARPWRSRGDFVLYWMTSQRRGPYNFALERAAERAAALDKPLIVLEALRCDYRYASPRLHRFVLDGMRANRAWFAARGVAYHPYVEPEAGAGRGLIAALSERAAGIVADENPGFFLPAMLRAAAQRSSARLESIDGCGLLPLSASGEFTSAMAFRRQLQRELAGHLGRTPAPDALQRWRPPPGTFPATIARRWPAASDDLLEGGDAALSRLPLDGRAQVVDAQGGHPQARVTLDRFLGDKLQRYDTQRNDPDANAESGLSPYLHFGHISPHEVLAELALRERWNVQRMASVRHGRKHGWWKMSPPAEAFLDQLVTWRELGLGFVQARADAAEYGSLPAWAQDTLARHAGDPRPWRYDRESFEAAATHDELWNAAQRQLLREGRIHNYLRMLWGKKILEWSATPREALATMLELNDRYALDGRDPNSLSGIFWCLGRFDRPWPERAVYGVVRSMSSQNTARKLELGGYLARFGR